MHDYISGEYVYGDYVYGADEYLDERWWYIDGAPGYLISDHGRVWSAKTRSFIKPKPMDKQGHIGVCLSIDGQRRYEYLHRLMAKAFIPNPNQYPIVRHLNDSPPDNELENLDWGTQKDNFRDCVRNGHAHFVTRDEREIWLRRLRRPVLAINIRTGEKKEFVGQTEAGRVLGIQQANIWKVLNGERQHACGYRFEYVERGDMSD